MIWVIKRKSIDEYKPPQYLFGRVTRKGRAWWKSWKLHPLEAQLFGSRNEARAFIKTLTALNPKGVELVRT